jgi:hypothetical protein
MSGIDNAKQGMGWLHPNARAACGNCEHVESRSPANMERKPIHWCGKGGFITPRFAICDQYTPMMLTTGSVPK